MMFQNLDTCIIVKVATVISDLEEYTVCSILDCSYYIV